VSFLASQSAACFGLPVASIMVFDREYVGFEEERACAVG
jgi:hypothetical protein